LYIFREQIFRDNLADSSGECYYISVFSTVSKYLHDIITAKAGIYVRDTVAMIELNFFWLIELIGECK